MSDFACIGWNLSKNNPDMKYFVLCMLIGSISARTWTDTKGRTIEAEIVSANETGVIVDLKGVKTEILLKTLSDEDKVFVSGWIAGHAGGKSEDGAAAPDTAVSMLGIELVKGGKVTIVEKDLPRDVISKYSEERGRPSQLRLGIALPKGFDPTKPQWVFWVSVTVFNDSNRQSGNLGVIREFAQTGVDAGWVVIAVDTDLGNPRWDDREADGGRDQAVQLEAITLLRKTWPAIGSWTFVCGGHGGGGKASFFRAGHLTAGKLNVKGLYLSRSDQELTEKAVEETEIRDSQLGKMDVWYSHVKTESGKPVPYVLFVEKKLKQNGYKTVRLENCEGGEELDKEDFTKALDWFADSTGKP